MDVAESSGWRVETANAGFSVSRYFRHLARQASPDPVFGVLVDRIPHEALAEKFDLLDRDELPHIDQETLLVGPQA